MTLYAGARIHLHELDLDGHRTGPPIASGRLLGDRIYPVRDDVYAFVVEDDGRIGAWVLTSDITAAFIEPTPEIPIYPPPPPGMPSSSPRLIPRQSSLVRGSCGSWWSGISRTCPPPAGLGLPPAQ